MIELNFTYMSTPIAIGSGQVSTSVSEKDFSRNVFSTFMRNTTEKIYASILVIFSGILGTQSTCAVS